ncbi:Predicted arabinose efflux permease, MFS family [Persephonella hydrogeniphila]|uniref:Predicted arabinose efflux permease, MFS family n=1 Tax=Persephonella hydrogeniphila TaxID=198703 RepID=A0A285N7E7_9AQUI|nr:Predicted arabinose efflux permease, MFS family [Persephonella hydrogeniphila]
MIDKDFTVEEKKATLGLASIFSLRMLGLFLVLPVLSIYAHEFPGATSFLVGIAIGAYGLTQAFFQIPYGLLSDKIGRIPILIFSTIIFILGSLLAAYASLEQSIYLLIIGRFLQGMGAVSSVVIALIADLTREEIRTRAMATIGASIGMAFAFGMVLGPWIAAHFGLAGVFGFTALLALFSLPYIIWGIPRPKVIVHHDDAEFTGSYLGTVLKDKNLLKMDFGMFTLHMGLTAVFTSAPLILKQFMDVQDLWKVYLVMFLVGLTFMVPTTIIAEKKGLIKEVKILGILILIVSFGLFMEFESMFVPAIIAIIVYFTGFMILEPIMPSLMSRYAKPHVKGTASGVFNTAQFLGAFVGGAVGGYLLQFGHKQVFIFLGIITIIWLITVLTMEMPESVKAKRKK